MDTINRFAVAFGAVFMVLASPFVVAHVVDTWDAEEYPHSGFCPDYPVWCDNTLPPVQEGEAADACSFGVTRGGAR